MQIVPDRFSRLVGR